jgi:hypothetical protein
MPGVKIIEFSPSFRHPDPGVKVNCSKGQLIKESQFVIKSRPIVLLD